MPKKVTIKENLIEETPQETADEIEPEEPQPQPPAEPALVEQKAPPKADGRTRMRELYRCEYCNKYLTKKSLNYSHAKYCKGQQPEQVQECAPVQEAPPEIPQTRLSLMEQFRREKQMLKLERIQLLARNIA